MEDKRAAMLVSPRVLFAPRAAFDRIRRVPCMVCARSADRIGPAISKVLFPFHTYRETVANEGAAGEGGSISPISRVRAFVESKRR